MFICYCSVRHPERSIAYDLMRHWQPFYKSFLTDMGAYVMSAQVRIGLGGHIVCVQIDF